MIVRYLIAPASDEIEKSNLLNCSYVLEISSQGVSDELTSERDFKTFKGFPVKKRGFGNCC